MVSVRISVNKINTSALKMIILTTCKGVNYFSNVARVNYSIVTSRLNLHQLLVRW